MHIIERGTTPPIYVNTICPWLTDWFASFCQLPSIPPTFHLRCYKIAIPSPVLWIINSILSVWRAGGHPWQRVLIKAMENAESNCGGGGHLPPIIRGEWLLISGHCLSMVRENKSWSNWSSRVTLDSILQVTSSFTTACWFFNFPTWPCASSLSVHLDRVVVHPYY